MLRPPPLSRHWGHPYHQHWLTVSQSLYGLSNVIKDLFCVLAPYDGCEAFESVSRYGESSTTGSQTPRELGQTAKLDLPFQM